MSTYFYEERETEMRNVGMCCACGGQERVRHVVSLPYRTLVSGTGWGCLICNLPSDGAIAVLCEKCGANNTPIRYACYGDLADRERISISALTEPFQHNDVKHRRRKFD